MSKIAFFISIAQEVNFCQAVSRYNSYNVFDIFRDTVWLMIRLRLFRKFSVYFYFDSLGFCTFKSVSMRHIDNFEVKSLPMSNSIYEDWSAFILFCTEFYFLFEKGIDIPSLLNC